MSRAKETVQWVAALGLVLAVVVATVLGLGNALWHLVVAFGLAYLCFPLVQRLEEGGLKRAHASIAIIAAVVLVGLGVVALLVSYLVQEAAEFARALPQSTESAVAALQSLAQRVGLDLDLDAESLMPQLREYASSLSPDLASSVASYAESFFSSTAGIVVGVVNLYLVPVFFYYVVNDYEAITSAISELVPRPHLLRVERVGGEVNLVIKGYVRGQLVLAAIRAALFGLGLAVLGLDFGLLVGLITGLLTIIPYAGVTVGLLCVAVIAAAGGAGWGMAIGVGLLFALVTALDHLWLRPHLIERPSGLGEFGVMMALMIGGNLLGLVGLLLAIPVAGVLKILLRELAASYRSTAVYQGAPVPASAKAPADSA